MLPKTLRDYQIELIRDERPEVVCVSSTQVGKTFAYACKVLARIWDRPSKFPWWWCAPTYAQSKQGQRIMYHIAESAGIRVSGPRPPFDIKPPPPLVILNGGVCEYRTWEDPSNLMGDPIDGAVIDEGGLLPPHAHSAISTRRSFTLGPLWWIGNPGVVSGPFRGVAMRAQNEGRLHRWTWQTLHAWYELTDPAKAAEYAAFIEQERASIPDFEFRRLYEAEWTEDEAAVFRGVNACLDGNSKLPGDSDRFVLGVDVGQSVDYLAVVSLGRQTRRLELRGHFRGVSYPQAAERIKALQASLGNAPCVLEVNGAGVALEQEFRRIGVKYLPFTTTSQSKQEIVLALAADIASKRVKIAEHAPMPYELERFRYERMPSGVYRYSAPGGEHDDTVMAACLARWGIGHAVDLSEYGWMA